MHARNARQGSREVGPDQQHEQPKQIEQGRDQGKAEEAEENSKSSSFEEVPCPIELESFFEAARHTTSKPENAGEHVQRE